MPPSGLFVEAARSETVFKTFLIELNVTVDRTPSLDPEDRSSAEEPPP